MTLDQRARVNALKALAKSNLPDLARNKALLDKIEDVKRQVQEDLESELWIFDVLKEHKLEVVTDSHKDAYMLEKADELKKVPLDDRPDIPDALIDIMKEEAQTLKLQK